ncbi:SH3 domain-containing protein [Clostridium coskatii]|uniref:N-acetylmuramoyl-L-alanine amidase n=1 Tax=Clostridium coskatii TaxID=1705578 RepID=A0A162LHZ3_9CLOT|nr:SH3 domain-containing protein [Clostridium coskatii]OAA93756.1 Bacteriocin BCN5 [Clostridium coskatii]OBR96046.1 bacteriocin BCN5 [Clostridium coskatii]
MNTSKKLIFAFFMSASLMNSKGLVSTVYAADVPNMSSSAYTAVGNIFAKSGYTGQCTWFTYGRVLEKLGIALPSQFYGNAVDWWYANASSNVYAYGSEPKANSIVVWGGGPHGYGHVGFVEEVSGDTVYFNEGNFNIRGNYDGSEKTLSKEAIKNRGNLYLKGYIYVGDGRKSIPASNPSPSNNSSSNSAPVTNISKTGIVNISNSSSTLNVRNGAATSFGVIGGLKKGQSVAIVGSVGSWYKIKYNSSYGYVSSSFISASSQASPSSQPSSNSEAQYLSPASAKSGYVKLSDSSSSLNLRTSPGGSVIGSLANGTAVNILGTSGSWYKVTANGKSGYVSSSYISNSQSIVATAASVQSTTFKTGTVTLSNKSSVLNLRSNPWTGRIVSTLSSGTKVTITGTDGRWYKVTVGSLTGYVHSDYIK